MEKEADLESKYHRLAAEYSKVRSQATVLKKAVLEEQTKNAELNDFTKKHEQTIRKRDQEIESLIFRNDQLTKRVTVLQQELQINNKKGKNKSVEPMTNVDLSVLNEELQKKILENAQLFNAIAEKETEVLDCKENVKSLEDMVSNLQKELQNRETCYKQERDAYKKEITELKKVTEKLSLNNTTQSANINDDLWKIEADRWKAECDILRAKPDSSDKLTDFYESQLSKILESNMILQSKIKTLWADNLSLKSRLEHAITEYNNLKENIKTGYEELAVTNENYKSQLDVLTEHLAAQNEKITQQCDEIELLKHRLSSKK